MSVPFVIDNITHRLSDTLNDLVDQSVGKPFDVATAYFSISGYKILKDGLHHSALSVYYSVPSRRQERN